MVPRNLFAINIDYKTFNTDNNLGINFETGPFSHKVLVGVDYSHFRQVSGQAFTASTPDRHLQSGLWHGAASQFHTSSTRRY